MGVDTKLLLKPSSSDMSAIHIGMCPLPDVEHTMLFRLIPATLVLRPTPQPRLAKKVCVLGGTIIVACDTSEVESFASSQKMLEHNLAHRLGLALMKFLQIHEEGTQEPSFNSLVSDALLLALKGSINIFFAPLCFPVYLNRYKIVSECASSVSCSTLVSID